MTKTWYIIGVNLRFEKMMPGQKRIATHQIDMIFFCTLLAAVLMSLCCRQFVQNRQVEIVHQENSAQSIAVPVNAFWVCVKLTKADDLSILGSKMLNHMYRLGPVKHSPTIAALLYLPQSKGLFLLSIVCAKTSPVDRRNEVVIILVESGCFMRFHWQPDAAFLR